MNINAFLLRQSFWIKDYFHHSPIGKPYREIKFLSETSYEKGLSIRYRKLKELLQFARKNTVFYKEIQSDNLSDYPVQNKLSLIANFEKIKVEEGKIPGQRGKVHIQKTSGSTGTPLSIPQDTMKRNRRIAELKYFGKIVGFNSHEKLIHLRTWNRWQNKTTKQIRQENIIPFDISQMDEKHLDKLCSLIYSEKAVCLRGYASSFGLLAQHVKKHKYKFPTLKIIIAGSETLHDDVRSEVKKT